MSKLTYYLAYAGRKVGSLASRESRTSIHRNPNQRNISMCSGNSKQDNIMETQLHLRNAEEYLREALYSAKEIRDPDLVKKVEKLHTGTQEVQTYITSKTDPKMGG